MTTLVPDQETTHVITTRATFTPKVNMARCPSLHSLDCVFAELDESGSGEPVSFPEYGKDLIEKHFSSSSSGEEEETPKPEAEGDVIQRKSRRRSNYTSLPPQLSHASRSLSWEDNWLFSHKRNKMLARRCRSGVALYHEPVSMLVPNPNDSDKFPRAMIGEKDVDEVSELSERQSVASIEFSSSSSEGEESVHEGDQPHSLEAGQQRDLEHTEYAVLPQQKASLIDEEASDQSAAGRLSDVQFVKVPSNVVIHEGKRVTFKCTVKGSRPIGN